MTTTSTTTKTLCLAMFSRYLGALQVASNTAKVLKARSKVLLMPLGTEMPLVVQDMLDLAKQQSYYKGRSDRLNSIKPCISMHFLEIQLTDEILHLLMLWISLLISMVFETILSSWPDLCVLHIQRWGCLKSSVLIEITGFKCVYYSLANGMPWYLPFVFENMF